ncbi:MAG: TonB-dependent receptor [Cyclobacteriaceae bacterium]
MHSAIIKPLLSAIIIFVFGILATAQTTISGSVTDEDSGEPLIGVNILVKGTVLGTITDYDGNFELNVSSAPPLTLTITSVGYERQSLEITNSTTSGLDVKMTESFMLGQEVVVSASRVEENILQSPVSIEKMDILAVQNTSADNYYKAIANLKGVDVSSSSINFQIINARGFASTGNTRFVQLIDGMDTQAPALNFPIGNLNGPSELDVESVELIPGASSALYGPNAFNGILLINSKNPFDYQGASAFVKTGVNHVGSDADQSAAPMYEASIRYAKAFNDKFAFKVNFSYMQADDWHGTSETDRNAGLNPFASIGESNPGSDRYHYMGDEASLNLNILRFSRNSSDDFGWQQLATSGLGIFRDETNGIGETNAWEYAQNGFLPSHVVSAPGYKEANVVDYGAENKKLNLGLFYRLNDKAELSYLFNGGWGTSIYTGAQRYSLKNFGIQQHRLQLRGDNFFIKAYTTRERSGDSYIAEFLGKRINDSRYGGDVSGYLTEYPLWLLRYYYNNGIGPDSDASNIDLQTQLAAHQYANAQMESRYPLSEGESDFETTKKTVLTGTVPDGPLFDDKSNMYQGEAQYDFKNQIDFMELQTGASFRMFELKSNGTIFPDTVGAITIKEFGAYAQAGKKVNDNLKFSGSIRFDKNENFKGQVNPRLSAVYTVNRNHNFRVSYQTGFRNPTTQGQYISLDIISARLLGGLPQFYEFYDLTKQSSTGVPLAYTGGSVNDFRDEVFSGKEPFDPSATSLLEPVTSFKSVKPERVRSIEFGYKSLIQDKLLVDAVYFYNVYTDFITQVRIVKADELTAGDASDVNAELGVSDSDPGAFQAGDPAYNSILNGTSTNTFQIYTNFDETVRTQGAALGLTYSLPRGYTLSGNYSWNKFLSDYNENALNEFNTPEHKANIQFGNRKLTDNIGFNMTFRWQEAFRWESSFAIGNVPAYSTLDAQVSYKMSKLKSVVKLGGSNIGGKTYQQSFGGPNIGSIYYISITFDELMN